MANQCIVTALLGWPVMPAAATQLVVKLQALRAPPVWAESIFFQISTRIMMVASVRLGQDPRGNRCRHAWLNVNGKHSPFPILDCSAVAEATIPFHSVEWNEILDFSLRIPTTPHLSHRRRMTIYFSQARSFKERAVRRMCNGRFYFRVKPPTIHHAKHCLPHAEYTMRHSC